jgi:hypothetical protein
VAVLENPESQREPFERSLVESLITQASLKKAIGRFGVAKVREAIVQLNTHIPTGNTGTPEDKVLRGLARLEDSVYSSERADQKLRTQIFEVLFEETLEMNNLTDTLEEFNLKIGVSVPATEPRQTPEAGVTPGEGKDVL